ncbi:MAG: hypothetical protein ABSG68_05700 [Thermoguttaceae bacterium]|jgi:tetratricopeptide (TPR) repeat protein
MRLQSLGVVARCFLCCTLFWALASPAAAQTLRSTKEPAALAELPTEPPATIAPHAAPAAAPTAAEPIPAEPTPATPIPAEPKPAAEEKADSPSAAKHADPTHVEVASLRGVTPGESTMEDVRKAWGPARQSREQDKTIVQLHAVQPFDRVEVSYFANKVTSIIIRFDHSFLADKVAQQLDLDKIQPALISSDLGEVLGQVYPERGISFAFEPGQQPGKGPMKITHIVLEPVTAEPFILRAEANLDSRYDASLHDLDEALKLQPDNARAHWLRSRALAAMGELEKAAADTAEAVRLDPKEGRYRATRAQFLSQAGELTEATAEARKALELGAQRPYVKARALCLLGDLAASGLTPNYKQAADYYSSAIQEAGAVVASKHPAVRTAAKEVLVDAHLGGAHAIAWGSWRQKDKVVEIWLDKASTFAEDLIKNEEGSEVYRFRVATRALGACVGLRGSLEPAHWAQEAIRSGDALIAAATVPSRKAEIQWELGLALYDALQIYQARSDHDAALKYGELAVEYIERSKRQDRSPMNAYFLGRLYFRLGAIHAIREDNHRTAVAWFDKALPLFERPLTREAFFELGRHGETLVAMGVSYWKTGQHQKAITLTERGVGLMEQAMRRGASDTTALVVPYNNLAWMHRQLGEAEKADRYQAMATKNQAGTVR